jgi:DNA-binding SARP family transcriptional activator
MGGFDLRQGDTVVELSASSQRLVALLSLRGRMTRSRLAGTIWPETHEARALASLRTGIWRTNQTAPRLVSPASGVVDLCAGVDVDTRRFVADALQLMRSGSGHELCDPRESATAPRIASFAAELLTGDNELLPDWQEDWLMPERERLRQLRLHLLESTAATLSHSGDYGLALEVALAAVRTDMLRESAHRCVIRIHLAEGNLVEAQRAFDACRELLQRSVGVDPTPETVELMRRDRYDFARRRGPTPVVTPA